MTFPQQHGGWVRRLVAACWEHRALVVLSLLAAIFSVGVQAVSPLLVRTAVDDAVDGHTGRLTGIAAKQNYRYLFDARVREFAQLLPNYMHVRFSGAMLVSPRSVPEGDVFERKDNYYVYLKAFDVADETVLKRMRFFGRPPVWIPMPPH